jgi:hypothetical protein
VFTQPLLGIHLDTEIEVPSDIGFRPIGNRIPGHLRMYSFVLVILQLHEPETARSLSRAKEVSLRKVAGSGKKAAHQAVPLRERLSEPGLTGFRCCPVTLLRTLTGWWD